MTRSHPARGSVASRVDVECNEPVTPAVIKRFEKLSPRQREVLGLIALGLSNREIAGRLFVTVHAVNYHVSAIYQKLEVANRTEAAVLYWKMENRQTVRNGELED
jgi:DNA-binding NarL/FixJ family response regulator